ncbi:ACT domain-containing protein [Oscillospiraceae bacterium LTW-04]|nr:ACT domain-containing protein [Oscillospiraceae bacterium MB24-C1]
MEIMKIEFNFSVCKVTDFSKVDLNSEYCFIGKTNEENSLVCIKENIPDNTIERDDGWKAFRIQGVLDFSLIGILSKISTLLAENQIGIFAISTYNTDYILTKEENYLKALEVLLNAGYQII